jgi:stress-induced morphogen
MIGPLEVFKVRKAALTNRGEHTRNSCGMPGPVESLIERKLSVAFAPTHLSVINESSQHNVAPGSETHFKVVVVSESFASVPLLERHRAVNETLADELKTGVHALSIVAKTPDAWARTGGALSQSPPCLGGSQR